MAKTNNLTDFLTDLANAIRTKKGTSGTINPQDFSSEIASIPTGSVEVLPTTKPMFKKLFTNTWSAKTWLGLTSFYGDKVWTDGSKMYIANYDTHYELDKETNTWTEITWSSNISKMQGSDIWTDGENIYYSNWITNRYVTFQLVKGTYNWVEKTWNGFTDIYGSRVWTDGENIYCHDDLKKTYVLDKATSTWSEKTWNGSLTSVDANVWTDGKNIYYSYGTNHYVLDKTTSTWTAKTWTGLTNFIGSRIWTDGKNIYYSHNQDNYVLNGDTWVAQTWSGLTSIFAGYVWTDGENIYHSNGASHYELGKATLPLNACCKPQLSEE